MQDTLAVVAVVIVLIALFLGAVALYFLPTIIARSRGMRRAGSVTLINLLFGWSGLGWIAAAIWAICGKGDESVERA